jgi:hypothetical protein
VIWLLQLALDCQDPDAITAFWGRLLEYDNGLAHQTPEEVARFRTEHPQFDGRGRIDDRELRRMPVYLQRVPEPKVGRNRVRLEVTAPADDLANGDYSDPEGNEYTVKVDDSTTKRHLSSIVFDAQEPQRLAEFWAAATGYLLDRNATRCTPQPSRLRWTGDAFAHPDFPNRDLLHITGSGAPVGPARYDLVPALAFNETDEPKTGKNRLHVDLSVTDPLAERDRLVQLGATVLHWNGDQVLADPEGNEFCLGGRTRAR